MTNNLQVDLARRYFLEDLVGALRPGARLNGVIAKMDAGENISDLSRIYLKSKGLFALEALAAGQVSLNDFQARAEQERIERIRLASAKAAKEAAEAEERNTAMDAAIKAYFSARESDPLLQRRREGKELRRRFGMGFIEEEYFSRVMNILRQVSGGQRLKAEEVLWLKTEAEECWTDELEKAWHALEADVFAKAWETGGDAWSAVNASGHWRKADQPEKALSITQEAIARDTSAPKLKSALMTTRGGAMRDLRRLEEARSLAEQAHDLNPKDYRPCTLLGAVHIETGELATGYEWYRKAEILGAPREIIDHDIRSLIAGLPSQERDRIRSFLIAQDPQRFSWLVVKRGKGNPATSSKFS